MNPPMWLLGAKVAYKHDQTIKGEVIAIHAAASDKARAPGEWEYMVLLDQPSSQTQAWFSESKLVGGECKYDALGNHEPNCQVFPATYGTGSSASQANL